MPKLKPILCDWPGAPLAGDCNEPATHELLDIVDGDGYPLAVRRYCARHAVMALEDALRTDPRMAVRQ